MNVCIGVLGCPGSGKSTYAIARAMQYAKMPAYVFAHDNAWRLPEKLPDGRPTGLVRHTGFKSVTQALATNPRGIHAISTLDAGEVIEYARRVSESVLRSNRGAGGPPSIVLIDEVVSAADANPYRLGTGIRETLALRRHQHVGLIWTAQSARLCHHQLLALGTEIVVFRAHHKKDFDALSDIGLTDEELDIVAKLPPFQYIVHIT